MRRAPGFTLIELLVTLAILGILAAAAFPLSEISARRAKEKELREALWQIRSAIDTYKKAGEDGRIAVTPDQPGYPPDLVTLVEGVPAARTAVTGAGAGTGRIYFLRRIPRDPFADDSSLPADKVWGKRSYESPPDAPHEGKDVYDVYSLSTRTGLNGVPYNEW